MMVLRLVKNATQDVQLAQLLLIIVLHAKNTFIMLHPILGNQMVNAMKYVLMVLSSIELLTSAQIV